MVWKNGFATKYVTLMLSHHRISVESLEILSSLSNHLRYMTSAATLASDLYSASVFYHDTISCILEHHDTKFLPKDTI